MNEIKIVYFSCQFLFPAKLAGFSKIGSKSFANYKNSMRTFFTSWTCIDFIAFK